MPEPIRHLYAHVPFCPTICPYCDFHVLERRAGLVDAYLIELEREATRLSSEFPSDLMTIYVGGGTPSFLRDHEISSFVTIVRDAFGWVPDFKNGGEATLEVNPGTVTRSRAKLWRDLGFDRASLGVQSTQDDVLKFLGRTHDAKQALESLEILLETGFRVSADLITAVPGQDVERDLRALASVGLEHISAYTLTIEDGTPFARLGVKVREEDEERALELAETVLLEYGLARYEVSNHAKPGFESRHNIAYWDNRFWFGLGPSATGHYPLFSPLPLLGEGSGVRVLSERRKNPPLQTWLEGQRATLENGSLERVTPEEFVTDALFSGLRLKRGVNLTDLSSRAGMDVSQRFADAFASLESRGLLERDGDVVRATHDGIWVLNQVVAEFL
jgi:putative oxygen-independent coproporphyrinogen III oxidase